MRESILQSEAFWRKLESNAMTSMPNMVASLPSLDPPDLGEGAATRRAQNGGGDANVLAFESVSRTTSCSCSYLSLFWLTSLESMGSLSR